MLPMVETGGKLEDGFRFTKRELATQDSRYQNGWRTVWVWVDTYTGDEGGKCSTKAEAWKWARHSRRVHADEAGLSIRAFKKRAKA